MGWKPKKLVKVVSALDWTETTWQAGAASRQGLYATAVRHIYRNFAMLTGRPVNLCAGMFYHEP
jgi:hypothetical protein